MAAVHQVFGLEVLVFELTLVSAAERGLHRVHAGDLKFAPHRDSSGRLLAKIVREARVLKAEVVAQLRD